MNNRQENDEATIDLLELFYVLKKKILIILWSSSQVLLSWLCIRCFCDTYLQCHNKDVYDFGIYSHYICGGFAVGNTVDTGLQCVN